MDYSKMTSDELKAAIDNADKKINKLNAKIGKMRNAGMTEEDFDNDLEQIEQLKKDKAEMESAISMISVTPTEPAEPAKPEEPLAPAKPSTTAALKEAHDKYDTGVQKVLNNQQEGTKIKGTHGTMTVEDPNTKTGLNTIKSHTVNDNDFEDAKNWIDAHQKQWKNHLTEKAYADAGYDTPEKLAGLLHDNPEEYKNVTKRVKDYVDAPDNQLSPKELLEAFYVRNPRIIIAVSRYNDYKNKRDYIDNAFKEWKDANPRLLSSVYKMSPETQAVQDQLDKLRVYTDTDWDEKQSNAGFIRRAINNVRLSDPYEARNVGINARTFSDKFDENPVEAVKDYLNLENHFPKTGKGFEVSQDINENTPDPKQGIGITFNFGDVSRFARDGFGLTTRVYMKNKNGDNLERIFKMPPAVSSKLVNALKDAYDVQPRVTATFEGDSSNMKDEKIQQNLNQAVKAFTSGDWSPLAERIFGKQNLGTQIFMGRNPGSGKKQWYTPKTNRLNYTLPERSIEEEQELRQGAEKVAISIGTNLRKAIEHYRDVMGNNGKNTYVPLTNQLEAVKRVAENMRQQKNNAVYKTGDKILYTLENADKVTEPVLKEAERLINNWINKNIKAEIKENTQKSNRDFMDQVGVLMRRVPEMARVKSLLDKSNISDGNIDPDDPEYTKLKNLKEWYDSHGGDAQLNSLMKFVEQQGGSFADFKKKWASKNSTKDLGLLFKKYDSDGKFIGNISADELFDSSGQPKFNIGFNFVPWITESKNIARADAIGNAERSAELIRTPGKQLGSFELLDDAIADISDVEEKNALKANALQSKIDKMKELQPYYRNFSKTLSELPDEQKGLEEAKSNVVLRETKFKELGGNKRIAELESAVMSETDPDKVDRLNAELQNLYTARSNLSRAMATLDKKNKDKDLDAITAFKDERGFDEDKINALAYIDAGGDEGLAWLNKQLEDVLNGKETSDRLYSDYRSRKWKREDRAARGINIAHSINMLNDVNLSDSDIANNSALLQDAMNETIPDSHFITDEDKMLRKNYKDYAKTGDNAKSYVDTSYDDSGNPVYESMLYSVPDINKEELEDIKAQKRIYNKQARRNVNANNRYKYFMQQIEKSFNDDQDIIKIGDSVCNKDLLKYIFPAGIKSVANLLSSKNIAHNTFDEAEAINAIARRVKLVNALNDDNSLLSKLGISKIDELKRMMAYEEAQNMKPVDRKHYVDVIMGDKNEK